MKQRMIRWFVAPAMVAFLCGCGGADRESAEVTGNVQLNGQPVEGVIVRFQPVGSGDATEINAGVGSYGETDENGEFSLRFADDGSYGAMIGEHTIVIDERTPEEEELDDAGGIGEEPESRIPPKWRDSSQHFVVKEGTNQADIELSQ